MGLPAHLSRLGVPGCYLPEDRSLGFSEPSFSDPKDEGDSRQLTGVL